MAKRANGEGSIYQRKDGKWMGSLTISRNNSGKSTRRTVYGATKEEVAAKMDSIKHEIIAGAYVEPESITVQQWINYWLISYKKNKVKPRTYDSYESLAKINLYPNIGQKNLQKLSIKDIQELYNKKYEEGLSANTIHKVNIVLKSALNKAITEGYLIKNPANFVEIPEIEKKVIKAFTPEEQMRFETNAKDYRLYEAFIVNLDTGLRTSEILALTWDDIDLDKGEISVNKNIVLVKDRKKENGFKTLIQDSSKTKNSTRTIPLTQRSLTLLKQLKLRQQSLSNIVFCSEVGTYMSSRNYSRTFQKILAKAKISICNCHTMRHTFATRLFEKGAAPKAISQLLGHASVSFTLDTYTHVAPSMKKTTIELLEKSM
jgi:integrase